MKQIIVGK